MNILIINGHQRWEKFSEGKLNKTIESYLFHNLKSKVVLSRVDQEYDVLEELEKWKEADVIIYLFPVFWMSVPWKMKKYLEEIFMSSSGVLFSNDGRTSKSPQSNYGSGGLSQNKKFMMVGTMNAPKEAFGEDQFFEGNFDTLMHWLVKNNHFIGLTNQIPSVVFNDVVKNPQIETDLKELESVLKENNLLK